MPETASVGDKFQVRVVGTTEGAETNNVMHFMAATAVDDVELRLIAALVACFVEHLLPVTSGSWALQKLVWKRVSPTLGIEHVFVPPEAGAGSGPAQALPSFCAAVVSIRTAEGGRSKRGRMYLPGIPENATANSVIDPTNGFWTELVAFVACVVTKFVLGDPPAANSFQWMVYSRKIGGATFPYGANGFTAVTNAFPNQLIGSARSRKVGRGS